MSGKQQHQLRRQSNPPARGLDFRDHGSGIIGFLWLARDCRRAAPGNQEKKRQQRRAQEKELKYKRAEMPEWSFHGQSIRKKGHGSQHRAWQKTRGIFHYFALALSAKINFPNASGTWKFGSGVPVGCHAE